LLTDQDEFSKIYRGSSMGTFYRVSVHLAKRLQKRIFLEINQSEKMIACGGHVC
jgi:hypothetical protein